MNPTLIPAVATFDDFTIEFAEVAAWENRMPSIGAEEREIPRHLVLTTIAHHRGSEPMTVELDRAYLSFDPAQLGEPASGVSLADESGAITATRAATVPPGESQVLKWRGLNAFELGHPGTDLFVTLQLRVDGRRVELRRSGRVIQAM